MSQASPKACSCKRFLWPTQDDRAVALCRKCDYPDPRLTLDEMGFNAIPGAD